MTNDLEFFKAFLDGVGVFFTLYLIGYSTFLFLSVFTGSSSCTGGGIGRLKNGG
ncbi:MAG: hypothetical protein ACLRJV_13545 [Eubacteriales bacterium]